jgi:histidinol dehydrogenase
MIYTENPSRENLKSLLKRSAADVSLMEEKVLAIMRDVRERGDVAVREYTEKFDGVNVNSFAVSDDEFLKAEDLLNEKLKVAIHLAKKNIEKFHSTQKTEPQKIETMPGVFCWRKNLPIEKVGLYIPGGSAPLFSTILMLVVPAQIAGCKEITVCTPPSKDGTIHPAILFTAKLCGVKNVLKIGGVQAIAAMAYGTETISAAYKIFGPGNSWVTCAKQLLSREGIAIDLPAGPSELAVYADVTVPPAFIAADLLSQAEHGVDSQVVVVATDKKILENIMREVENQLTVLPRKEIATESLKKSHAILVENSTLAMQLLNDYAPEHLILACKNASELSEEVINAGSVFLGAWSPESVGDYASGTNHTLPTNGYARAWSGVSLDSFVKKVTFQELTKEGLQNIGPSVEAMAEAEGLFAHKNAITVRLNNQK